MQQLISITPIVVGIIYLMAYAYDMLYFKDAMVIFFIISLCASLIID